MLSYKYNEINKSKIKWYILLLFIVILLPPLQWTTRVVLIVVVVVLRHRRWSDEPAAVCPECDCTSGVGCTTVRPDHAGATGAALASDSTSGGAQDCHSGLTVTVRHGPSLSGRRLSVGLRRRSPSPAFCHIEDVCCQTYLQQLWTGVLRLQVLDFGTAFQLICDKLTLALNNLNGY